MIFQNEKRPFQAIKKTSLKSRKIDIFPWFWSRNGHFPIFFIYPIQARKMSFMIFQNEETLFQAIKTRSPKSRKSDIFLEGFTHGFGSKNDHFSNFFFFKAIQATKISFIIFQKEKTIFQALKRRSSKNRKIDIFPMVLVQKRPFFQVCFFQEMQVRKMSFMIFQNEKTPFQAIKTRSSKSEKN